MKFTYQKHTPTIVTSDTSMSDVHVFKLDGGCLQIEASAQGVRILGESQFFQPVDEELKIPDEFREFMVRLSSAFEYSFKEQQKLAKEVQARRMILGAQ